MAQDRLRAEHLLKNILFLVTDLDMTLSGSRVTRTFPTVTPRTASRSQLRAQRDQAQVKVKYHIFEWYFLWLF